MADISVKVNEEEVDGDTPPIKTADAILALLKEENRDNLVVRLCFPMAHVKGNREGIIGWFRPRDYIVQGENLNFSKLIFLQESLWYEGGYKVIARLHLITDNYIELNMERLHKKQKKATTSLKYE